MMTVTAIRNEEDYQRAKAQIDELLRRLDTLSEEEDRLLEALSILAVDYEKRHHAIEPLAPVDYLHEYMAHFNRRPVDLAAIVGSRALASQILNRHRALSLPAIRKISAAWNIPISILAMPYELEQKRA